MGVKKGRSMGQAEDRGRQTKGQGEIPLGGEQRGPAELMEAGGAGASGRGGGLAIHLHPPSLGSA